jgi:hypothetical protein
MRTRTRFGVAFGALALVAAALTALNVGTFDTGSSARAVCPQTNPPVDPIAAAYGFISNEIDQRRPARAYALVTASFRNYEGCKKFLARKVEGVRFGRVDWRRSTYRVIASGTGQVVVNVLLQGTGAHPALAGFVMELQTDAKGRWQVGLWTRRKLDPNEVKSSAVAA